MALSRVSSALGSAVWSEGEPVPEGPQRLLLLLGDDAVSLADRDTLGEALLDGLEDAGVVVVRIGCDGPDGPA